MVFILDIFIHIIMNNLMDNNGQSNTLLRKCTFYIFFCFLVEILTKY